MKHPILALFALAAAAAPGHAADDAVATGPLPQWVTPSELAAAPADATGLVFARRNDAFVHFTADGRQEHVSYRMKLLHPNALQLGNVSLTWQPDAGTPTLHALRIHRDGQVIDITETAEFEILRREENLEAAYLDGLLTAVLRVPDLRVGDELEFSATIEANDPTLSGLDAGVLALAPAPPAGRHVIAISWENGYEPRLAISPDLQGAQERRSNSVRFRFDDPEMLAPPQDAPVRYGWRRMIEFSDYADWEAVSRHFAPLYDDAMRLTPDSPIRAEAARIAAAHADPLARAGAALELVQQQVRYVFVGLDGGNLQPATAEETWERRYGDCKGKTVLLLALLHEMGIEAAPVLVSNSGVDDGLNERLPGPALFDHVVVRARIDGTQYWLDGTLPPVATPSPQPVFPYEWVLPLALEGGALEHRPWTPAAVPQEVALVEIDARAGFDQPARVVQTTIIRGLPGLAEQMEFSALPGNRLLSAFQPAANGQPWLTIDDVQWRYDTDARASVLAITGTQIVDWDAYNSTGARRLSLPGGGFNPPQRRVRPEADDGAPFAIEPRYKCSVTTVRIPDSTDPSHWTFNSTFGTRILGRTYFRAFELRDRAINMITSSRTVQDEISVEAALADNARIANFDNSRAWVYHDPAGLRGPARNRGRVPATYEIDWTAPDIPCLSLKPGGG